MATLGTIALGDMTHELQLLLSLVLSKGLAIVGNDTDDAPDVSANIPANSKHLRIRTNGTLTVWDGSVWQPITGGGGSGTLQSITTGAGNNVTSNALQITGLDEYDPSIVGTIYAFVPGPNYTIIQNTTSLYSSSIQLINGGFIFGIGNGSDGSTNNAISFYSSYDSQPVIAEFGGRVKGQPAESEDQFALLEQTRKSFFVTTTSDAIPVLSDPKLANHELLKIEGYGTFFYETVDFEKQTEDDFVTMNESTLLPNSQYLVTIY